MIDGQLIGFAMAAGLVAALNPCGFALLPGYLTLVVAGESGAPPGRVRAVGRALGATAVMACGFLVVFGGFALIIAPVAASVQQYLPVVTIVIGAVLVLLGIWMLSGRTVTLLVPKVGGGAPTARLGSMFGYGIAYAIASLSCTIGPFLAVTGTTFQSGSIIGGIAAYVAYAAGMALLVGVLAAAIALATTSVTTFLRRAQRYLTVVGGALLVVTGAYVAYYGIYEMQLYHGDGDANDPVIAAAGQIQARLVTWVNSIGVWPLALTLVVLVLGAALATVYFRRRRRSAGEPQIADPVA